MNIVADMVLLCLKSSILFYQIYCVSYFQMTVIISFSIHSPLQSLQKINQSSGTLPWLYKWQNQSKIKPFLEGPSYKGNLPIMSPCLWCKTIQNAEMFSYRHSEPSASVARGYQPTLSSPQINSQEVTILEHSELQFSKCFHSP
jgi:hypothetical protein